MVVFRSINTLSISAANRRRQPSAGPSGGVGALEGIPEIGAEITFLSEEEGGRSAPLDLSAALYRPHLVVGDPNQREPIVRDGNVIDEDYLGVQFVPTGRVSQPGETIRVRLQLMYYPQVDYGALATGTTFTVREGGRIVAFGHVVNSGASAA